MQKISVYYDGKCGLCRREINHYKKIQPEGVFKWVDVTEHPNALKEHGISLADALMYLHVQDQRGQLHAGFSSFLVIWRGLGGGWRWLAAFMGLPVVRHIASWAYKHFAHWRFKRLDHCQTASRSASE